MKKQSTTTKTATTNKPLVSVVMPVYNASLYLKAAVESILYQTYPNIELIIVDDNSTDNSWGILKGYKEQFPTRIKLVRTKKNLNCGGDACANVAISKASGQYIARMDADDIAAPNRIAKQVAFLESHPEVVLVGTQAHVIDKNGVVIGEKNEPVNQKDIHRAYFSYHPMIHPSVMIRSMIDGKKFSYSIEYDANNDYLTFFKLQCLGFKFANLPEKLLYYRIHGKNDTFTNVKQKFANTYKIRSRMVASFGYRPSIKAWAIHFTQWAIISTLSEKILTNLYLYFKGISSLRTAIADVTAESLPSFSQSIRKVAFFL